MARAFPLVAAAILLAGCAPYAAVKERLRPTLPPALATDPVVTGVTRTAEAGPDAALATWLNFAREQAEILARAPGDETARDRHNFAAARVVDLVVENDLKPWREPIPVATSRGPILLTYRRDPPPQWNPELYTLRPADRFDVRGSYVRESLRKPGVGVPLVAVGREPNPDADRDFGLPRTFYGVTATLNFRGNRAVLALEDPLATEFVTLQGRRQPLAADFTVPLAVMLASVKPRQFEITRFLRPERYAGTTRLARLQPYDPDKTVVLVVHGLMDTPATWAPLINSLRTDERIRRNFQFWFFSYPTGYPYPWSAALLRRELDVVQKRFPVRRPMVVIGHSMGGCISRLLLTDPGERLWRDLLGKSPADTRLTPRTDALMREALLFEPRREIGRVIFMAAPLQGSDFAVNQAGRLGASLVRAPLEFVQAGRELTAAATFAPDELKLRRLPNSVDTLAPNNRFVRAVNRIPLEPGIPYHVISGDRGRGGHRDRTRPQMSDGVVPYWSSHMPGAKSELVVPSAHSVHQNPAAIEEVRRVLLEHAGAPTARP